MVNSDGGGLGVSHHGRRPRNMRLCVGLGGYLFAVEVVLRHNLKVQSEIHKRRRRYQHVHD